MFYIQDGKRVDKLDPRAVNVVSTYKKLDNTYVDVDYEWCKWSDFQNLNMPKDYPPSRVENRLCLTDP